MNYRMFSLGTVALAMFVVITPAIAANTHDGKVVSITGNKLVMKNTDGVYRFHVRMVAVPLRENGELFPLHPSLTRRVSYGRNLINSVFGYAFWRRARARARDVYGHE